MPVLVAYASRHGATQGIAERIAEGLRGSGLEAQALDVRAVRDVARYDAYVVGSAAYMFHWLKDATQFVRRNRRLLATRPLWLFSSGPLGTDTLDAQGRDVMVTSEPKEFAEFRASVHPRGEQIFFGAFDPGAPPVGLVERFMRRMPASDAMPAGDFRDWAAIDAWAETIARALVSAEATSGPAQQTLARSLSSSTAHQSGRSGGE